MKKDENNKKVIEDIAFGIRLGEWLDKTKKHCTKKEKIDFLKEVTTLSENTLDNALKGQSSESTKEYCVQAILEYEDEQFRRNVLTEEMEEIIAERKAEMCAVDKYIYKVQFQKRWNDWDFRLAIVSFAMGFYSMISFICNNNFVMYALMVVFFYVGFSTLKGSLWIKNMYNEPKTKCYVALKCMAIVSVIGLLIYGMFPGIVTIF